MNRAALAIRPALNAPCTGKARAFFRTAILLAVAHSLAQTGGGSELQQKAAAIKQSLAENQQKLHQYQWTETTQLMLKGDSKPPKVSMCSYGADGQVQKTPMSAPPPPPSGGRVKQRVIEKKKEEMQDYMGDVKGVLSMYVPPDPQKMQQAFQQGNVSLTPGNGMIKLAFKNYAQPGDLMTVSFNEASKKISHIDVNTYTQSPDQVVTLAVQMGSLPDGTNYSQQTVLNAKAKNLVVTTTNSNYQKLGN